MLARLVIGLSLGPLASAGRAAPVPAQVLRAGSGWQLLRGGKPYFIKGAGGDAPKELLARAGGNSLRTWSVDGDTQRILDEAERLGLTVTLGLWLGHPEHGFDYGDPKAVARQLEEVRRSVLRFKDHPALLVWALGNEVEAQARDQGPVWQAIQQAAKLVHELDRSHPTMTVVAELGGDKVRALHAACPDLDLVGINTYGGGPSVAERYRQAGGTKPIVLTEFGPAGPWETPHPAGSPVPEPTSTAKARAYRATYQRSVLGAPGLCLGSYAFAWGHKVEGTATWLGMFLADGSRLAAVDELGELWTGMPPPQRVPRIEALALEGARPATGGDVVRARVTTVGSADKLAIHWSLVNELVDQGIQGPSAAPPAAIAGVIEKNGEARVSVKLPPQGGSYRLACEVHDQHGGAAVGNLAFTVRAAKGASARFLPPVASLPLLVLSSRNQASPFTPAGWMGDTAAIGMDFHSADHPREGGESLRVDFRATKGWGGVAWQAVANDWGDRPGGLDLEGATKLTFWARGARGGERATFGFGLIGIDHRYHDSGAAKVEVALTAAWKQYTLPLAERDLSCIKSGFYWTVQGQTAPVTFYLDDVRYQ